MNKTDLTTYLNDHHAGSMGAIEMLDHLIDAFENKPLELFFKNLRTEIEADQRTLEGLIEKIGADESAVKKAGAWVSEKISRVKLGAGDPSEDRLELFQSLEALVLGITGKRALWTALTTAAQDVPELRVLDYANLEKRAVEQCDRVEAKRREVARELFSS